MCIKYFEQLHSNCQIILAHLQSLNIPLSPIRQIRKPKLGNLELIAMNLTAEYMD